VTSSNLRVTSLWLAVSVAATIKSKGRRRKRARRYWPRLHVRGQAKAIRKWKRFEPIIHLNQATGRPEIDYDFYPGHC
jgi:hypothetical protein